MDKQGCRVSTAGAGMGGCTPGYFNHEGEIDKPSQSGKELLKLARSLFGQRLRRFQGTAPELEG